MNLRPIEFAQELLEGANSFVPPVSSLLDMDYYKFTMGQFIFKNYRGTQVTFKLMIRDKDMPIGKHISEEYLRECLEYARSLRFTEAEIAYLRAKGIFGEDYLEFLRTLRLSSYTLKKVGDDFELTFTGVWENVTFWEIIGLPTVSELFYRAILRNVPERELEKVYARAQERMYMKFEKILRYPNIRFSDFGLRRRHSFLWQQWVVGQCKSVLGNQFVGTSNVLLAQYYDLPAIGTNAHELPMVVTALANSDDEMRRAPFKILDEWAAMYEQPLRIILPDTYTSKWFFENAPNSLLSWRGVRQDSGKPIDEGTLYTRWYQENGIDPKSKDGLYTDGLDVDPMIEIAEHFQGGLRTGFGVGTLLTNDFRGCYLGYSETVQQLLRPFSMVCKVIEANGRPCVKLSNNPSKATGPADEVLRYKKVFGVGEQSAQAVIV